MNKDYLSQLLKATILVGCFQLPIIAQTTPNQDTQTSPQIEHSRIKRIDRNTAQQKATDIFLAEGKFTIIKFEEQSNRNSNSIEKISMVGLSDSSRNNYYISKENSSGKQGKIVFVRQNEPIEFPGATTTEIPNLIVVTVDRQGNETEFIFNINNDNPEKFTEKIVITEPKKKPVTPPTQNQITIRTIYGEATPEDIKLGLDTLVEAGKLPKDDNLILQINEYYALTINGTSSKAARNQLDLPLSILQKIAQVGQEENTRRRLTAD